MTTIIQTVIQTIVDIGKVLEPILLSGLTLYFTVKSIKERFATKKTDKRWNNIAELLEQILIKNTCETEVKEAKAEIQELKKSILELKDSLKNDESVSHEQLKTLGQMIDVIFENSTLPMETKERLRALATKVEYASDATIVDELISQNAHLQEDVQKLQTTIDDYKDAQQVKIIADKPADTEVPASSKSTTRIIIQ